MQKNGPITEVATISGGHVTESATCFMYVVLQRTRTERTGIREVSKPQTVFIVADEA